MSKADSLILLLYCNMLMAHHLQQTWQTLVSMQLLSLTIIPCTVNDCSIVYTPVHCRWFDWTSWGECSRPCDGGERFRTREKVNEMYGGDPCQGEPRETEACNTHHCPSEFWGATRMEALVLHLTTLPPQPSSGDGGWSTWTQWTDCSTSCDNGTQTRKRECDNPTPAYGGRNCSGEKNETRGCFLRNCPGKSLQATGTHRHAPIQWLHFLFQNPVCG